MDDLAKFITLNFDVNEDGALSGEELATFMNFMDEISDLEPMEQMKALMHYGGNDNTYFEGTIKMMLERELQIAYDIDQLPRDQLTADDIARLSSDQHIGNVISRDEFDVFAKSLGVKDENIEGLWESFDTDDNGILDAYE